MTHSIIDSYRGTVKRFPGLHQRLYRIGSGYALPVLERVAGFHTPADDPLSFRWRLVFGLHERETVAVIRKLARRGHTALDLGAHVGYYTRLLARRVGRSGRVIAFEPHPRQFELLAGNLRGCANVQLVRKAAAASSGTATLFDALPETASSSLARRDDRASWCATHVQGRELAPRLRGDFTPRDYVVETVTIDQHLSAAGIDHVDFVKIDVEGAEMAVLQGMATTLASSTPMAMVMELNPETLGAFHCSPQSLLRDLRRHAFDLYTIEDVVKPLPLAQEDQLIDGLLNQQPGAHANLVCLRGYLPSVLE